MFGFLDEDIVASFVLPGPNGIWSWFPLRAKAWPRSGRSQPKANNRVHAMLCPVPTRNSGTIRCDKLFSDVLEMQIKIQHIQQTTLKMFVSEPELRRSIGGYVGLSKPWWSLGSELPNNYTALLLRAV